MRIVRHADAATFLARAGAWLGQAEAENNLILGVADELRAGIGAMTEPPYLVTLEDETGDVRGAALRTPPHALILTRASEVALDVLAGDLAASGVVLPKVIGPEETAHAFASRWRAATGASIRPAIRQGIYCLERVVRPRPDPAGALRPARSDEIDLLAEWATGFAHDMAAPPADHDAYRRLVASRLRDRATLERLVGGMGIHVWDDGGPVSMASATGPTPRGMRINFVYTPPARRRRGYASACVAALSEQLLRSGRRFTFLHTDLANDTSNAIYAAIGYKRIGTCALYELGEPER